MKKKLKDVTLGEINAECDKHYGCNGCPFHDLACYLQDDDNLNKEIELTENENDNE